MCVCFAMTAWWSMDTWLARSKSTGIVGGELCVRFAQFLIRVCMWKRLFVLPLGWHFDQASVVLAAWLAVSCAGGTASAEARAASAASRRCARSKGSVCCTWWRRKRSREHRPRVKCARCIGGIHTVVVWLQRQRGRPLAASPHRVCSTRFVGCPRLCSRCSYGRWCARVPLAACLRAARRVQVVVVQFQLQWQRGRWCSWCSTVAVCACAVHCRRGEGDACARGGGEGSHGGFSSPHARDVCLAGYCCWWAAGAQGRRDARSCAYRSPCGQWCSCCSACGTQGVQAVVVQVQLRRGRPRRPLLATFVQRAPCAALGDAAGAQGRRRASVQHAACHVVDGFKAVGCGLSSGEGGLCSLSSPCSIRGLSVVRCRCPRAVCRRVVDGSERWRYGFSSGEGGLSGLSSP